MLFQDEQEKPGLGLFYPKLSPGSPHFPRKICEPGECLGGAFPGSLWIKRPSLRPWFSIQMHIPSPDFFPINRFRTRGREGFLEKPLQKLPLNLPEDTEDGKSQILWFFHLDSKARP